MLTEETQEMTACLSAAKMVRVAIWCWRPFLDGEYVLFSLLL